MPRAVSRPARLRAATLAASLAALVLAPSAGPLAAQEASDSVPVFRVEPLQVSVLRARVDPASAPFAVSVLGEDALRRGKTAAFLEEALAAVPGVQVQNRYNLAMGERLSVRGFGVRAQFGVRGVKVLVDGIPATLPDGQSVLDNLQLGSLGRVEVLRGPGSALYGNAAGGVLAFHTEAPAPVPFRQDVRAVAGSHGLHTVDATSSGTTDGGTGWLVSLGLLGFDGFRAVPDLGGTYGSGDRKSVNARLLRPAGGGTLAVTVNAVDQRGENAGSVPLDVLEGAPMAWGNNVRQHTGENTRQEQVGVTWSADPAPGGVGVDASGWYVRRDNDGFIPPSALLLDRNAFGGRAIVSGRGERWSWDVGGEAELQRDARRNWANEGGTRGALSLDQSERVDALSAFAGARLEPAPRLHLTGALRYDRFRFAVDDRFTAGGDPDDSGTRVMDALDPTAGVVWEAAGPATLYANVATSLETPTTTELTNRAGHVGGFNPELQPARGVTVEGGLRGTVGGRLHYELTAFRTRVTDELVAFEIPESPGRSFFRNAGSSVHRGVEALVEAGLGGGVSTRVALTHIDARFDAYVVDGSDYGGNRLPGLAPTRVEGWLRWDGAPGFVALDGRWLDAMPVNDANTAEAPAHTLLGVRAGFAPLQVGGVDAAPFVGVDNLTDATYATSVVVNAFGGRYFEPGPGRTWYVGLSTGWSGR